MSSNQQSPPRSGMRRRRIPAAPALLLAAAIGVGQVSAYALNLVAAHVMGPERFGELASLLAILLVASVVALGIQAAGARRVVLLDPSLRKEGSAAVLRDSVRAALIVAAVTAALAPLLVGLLHLSGPLPVLIIAVATIPMTIMGGQLAITQGVEAHARLASVYLLTGLGRAGGGIAGVVLIGSVIATTVGVAIGLSAGIALGFIVVAPLVARHAAKLPRFRVEALHASHSLLVLFVLTNIDVMLARFFLPAEQAGIYAAGSIVAKVAFWLPQFVGVVAYPRMADHRRAATVPLAAGAVAIIGSAVVVGVALMPSLVVSFVGGSGYSALASDAWVFAAEGAAFSFAQFLLYSQLANGSRLAVVVLWVATASLVGLVVLFHSSVAAIVSSVLAVALAVCLIGFADMLIERRRPALAARG